MKESPILFKSEMVKAILEGRKTMTRRVIRPQLPEFGRVSVANDLPVFFWKGERFVAPYQLVSFCPYGQLGDRLWVRETWTYITKAWNETFSAIRPDVTPNGMPVDLLYRADGIEIPANWTPSIFMPRWASRITLEITGVRVERVQDISEGNAEAEGVELSHYYCDEGTGLDPIPIHRCDPIGKFADLWDSINAKRGYGWQSNPWVWVMEFKLV